MGEQDMSQGSSQDNEIDKAALIYHRMDPPGKLQIVATKPMANQRDLALAYSPGVAAACMLRFNFSFPMVLDNMTDEAESKYFAMPERLYVLDPAGKVTWKCGIGPHLFDPDSFETAIEAQLVALSG